MKILITGGAGFVGANVALALRRRHPDWEIVALDNLRRRGSELNLPRLHEGGVSFIHGDVRTLDDLHGAVEWSDALLECSAEPSVMAGLHGTPDYVVGSNLLGAYNCLELARRRDTYVIFLSTSRIYPMAPLSRVNLHETATRFELAGEQPFAGVSELGITEAFPLEGARTLYGATKLAAELLIEEYRAAYGLRAVVNRCGVIAGPWQMGKVDQGVFAHWVLAHHYGRPLRYFGYGGTGKQVRDLLHVDDLADLLDEQLLNPDLWDGAKVNVGGGRENSLSLLEATELCREITGNTVPVTGEAAVRAGDVPIYLSDCSLLHSHTRWRPRRGPEQTLKEIADWVAANEDALASAL